MLPTFCRVTGNSRNLPKPNYFPLLPPISPVEARRICRLMGKSVGSSEEELRHTYVPLIEFARISKAVKCHITSHADDQHHYQQTAAGNNGLSEKCRITAKHQINESYKYLYPIIGAKDANLKQLKSILDRMGSRLDTLTFQPGQRFVYQLDDNHLNLVLPADMEAAVRRGEIENLLLAKDGSSVLIRLKDGPSLTLNLRPMTLPVPSDMPPLLEGGGQDDEILAKQRQIRQYKKRKISDPKKNSVLSPTASPPPEESEQEQVIIADWTDRMDKITAYHRSAANLLTIGTDWRELLYPKIDNWDFESLPAIKEEDLPDLPVRNFQPVQLPANTMSPGLILSNQVPILNEESVGFEAVPVFDEVIRPFKGKLPANFVQELDKITATKDSSSTGQLKDLFSDVESLMFLPFIHEVGTVMTALERGRKGWMVRSEQDGVRFVTTQPVVKNEDKIRAVGGMMVPVGENEERFVVGQQSSTGFVPGKMVGEHFQPGCIVQNPEGVGFLPGYTFDGQFSAGQIMRDGKSSQFVNGQAVQTLFGPKFLPGRTIQTDGEGLKFIAGQTSSVDNKFHVGQIFQTVNGPMFISGVTFDTPQGARFVAGQVDMDGQFSAGQVLMDGPNGTPEFTMGENVETADGPLFLAGQSYKTKDGRTRFCPGRQMVLEDGQKRFVPGETMLTKEGTQFVAGILAEERFVPCKIDATQNNQLLLAAKEEEVFFRTGVSDGLPIDNSTFTAMPRKKPDMGYMIQVDEKVKFLPTEQGHDELMVGTANGEDVKVVPGQLMEMDDTPKFIPGKSIESALGSIFIPGQAVRTGPSKIEQFVPGQVIDTGTSKSAEGFTGPIFCPGQMVNCESGKKFVPGQVFGSKTGPRFVPGKILLSPSGASTFIPGQVLYSSDRGSVFVPGNIVDTNAGPYFVPGRVVDLPNGGIKFLAGEMIETDTGPRYVTEHETDLDLLDETEDQKEIVVQGFPVTPEELRLITAYPFAALHYPLKDGESIINSRMLRQMAAAGIAVSKLTNNPNANNNSGDVKVVAPKDIDESILGANVFRTTEPELPKPKKKVAPVILGDKLPEKTKVLEAEPLKLAVKVEGDPPPDVKWFKDPPGQEVVSDERTNITLSSEGMAELEINSADPEKDSGKYTMVAVNETGQVTCETIVDVQKKSQEPTLLGEKLPVDTKVMEGEPLKLKISIGGNPLPDVKWYKDPPGTELIPDERMTIKLSLDGTAELEIASADSTCDSGQYKMVAVNPTGQLVAQTNVNVEKKPKKATIEEGLPAKMTTYQGQLLKLSAKVSGHPRPDVKWYKDPPGNQIIPDERTTIELLPDGTATLEIASVDPAKDSGQYKMVAMNATGQATSQTAVEVSKKPMKATVDENLASSVIAYHGDPLKLKLKVSGNPLPSVKWFKDDKELVSNDRIDIKLSPDGTAELEIASADSSKDSGQYKMVAVNATGQCTSQTTVDVQKNKPKKATIEENLASSLTTYHGDPMKLKIKLGGFPLPDVKWFKDDKELISSERIIMKLTPDGIAELEIPSADLVKDPGQYKMIAVNALGQVTAQTIVQVQKKDEAPALEGNKLPTETKVMETEPLQLSVKLSGHPLPEVKWYKDPPGSEIVSSDRVDIKLLPDGTAKLEIASADSATDSGRYKMVAVNSMGEVISETAVHVEKKPKKATIEEALPEKVTTFQGQLLKLSAKVSGHPPPEVKWYKDPPGNELVTDERTTVELLPDGTAKLEISSVDPAKDSGQYKMVAVNATGQVTSQSAVEVSKKPMKATIDESLASSVIAYHGDPLKLKVKVSGNPLPSVKWYKGDKELVSTERIEIKLSQDGTAELDIASADSEIDSGVYKMVAINETGQSVCETAVDIQKNKPKKASIEENLSALVTAYHGEPLKLKVKVSGHPLPDVKWYKGEKELKTTSRMKIRISPDGIAEFEILSADSAKDSGQYKMVAVNASGQVTSQSIVDVQRNKPKQVTIDEALSSSVIAFHGEPLKLKLKLSGFPLPDVKWFKDEKELTANERMQMKLSADGTAEFEIASADFSKDSGEYKIVAVNPMGQVTSQTLVDIQKKTEAPTIVGDKLSAETKVMETEPLHLKVQVGGNPLPDVKWYKDPPGHELFPDERMTIKLSPDGTAELEIASTDSTCDSGEYKMVAVNPTGQLTSQTKVNVEKKPKTATIDSDLPPKITAYQGQMLKLTAKVSGHPLPAVKWYKGDPPGKELVNDERTTIRLLEDGTAELEIMSVDPDKDAGQYRMVVINSLGEVSTKTVVHVSKKPKKATIDEALSSLMIAYHGELLQLKLKISGNPLPDVKWYKDDQELTSDERIAIQLLPDGTAELNIASADSAQDSGNYKIVAVNATGQVTSETTVDVQRYKPKKATIEENLASSVIAFHGEQMKLQLKLSGHPLPDVKWFKDDNELFATERIIMKLLPDGTAELEIPSADSAQDSGQYKMVAVNATGQVTSQTNVDVQKCRPKEATIDEALSESLVAYHGQQMKLSLKISGHPLPEVKWFKDGKELKANERMTIKLSSDGTAELEIASADAAKDSGLYKMVAVNPMAQVTSQTAVDVQHKTEAPVLLGDKLPVETKVVEDDTLRLSVKVGGNPLPDVKWFKDGQGIVADERTEIELLSDGTAKLEITKADPVKDAGVYKMVAKNATGQITSQTTVNVEEKLKEAKIEEALSSKMTAFQGQPIKLNSKVSGNPLPDVKWYKDGHELTPDERTTVTLLPDGSAALEITSADAAVDSGQYKMVAENPLGQDTSETAVRVTKKPKKATVDEELSSTVTAYHGDPMKLKVRVSGNPLPEVKWYKDNEELIPDERLDIRLLADGTAEIEIASADCVTDSGLYKMVAINPTGQSTSQTTVDVKRYKPKLPTIDETLPPSVTAVQGQPLKLSGKVSGHPKPEVKWLKDGRLIRSGNATMSHLPDGTVSLEIKSAKTEDAGRYTLSVLNELGENECDTDVAIQALPAEPPVQRDFMSDPLILDFFKRIKTDLESVENDPYIKETLEAAETLAQTGGRQDLANTIRTLLDILKNTERDPEVVELIFGVLRSRQSKKPPSGADTSALHGLLGRALTNKLGWAKSPIGADVPGSIQTKPLDLKGLDGQNAYQNGCKSPIDEAKMIDKWQYLNGPVDNSINNSNTNSGRLRKISAERRHPRRVTSRSSSFARNMDLSEEASDDPDLEESELGINAAPRVFDPNNPIPTVINSAKDISHYVIDTLRYSRDEAKKEYYTQKIMEAVGLSYSGPRSSSNESDDGWKSAPASRKSSNNPSRKTSQNSPASACIILKDFLQTIVPAEAAHNVLIGQIDYMIIDDEGVRYFESAHGFASRRNSRYDIRLAAQETLKANRSRSGSVEPTNTAINEDAAAAQGPWPWADVGPRSRRASIDEFRKRLLEQDSTISSKARRSSSRERPPSGSFHSIHQQHGRHSVAAFPLSRTSSSGYVSPMASARSRRGSLAEDYCALYGLNAAGAANAALLRKRKVGTAGTMDAAGNTISSNRTKRFSQASFDESY